MRKCSKCGVEKPETEFHVSWDNRINRYVMRADCKPCEKIVRRRWQRTTPKGRAYKLKHLIRWQKTPAGKEQRHRWRQSEKGIASRKKWNEIWRKTEAGKIQRRRLKKRYELRKRIGTHAEATLTYLQWFELLIAFDFKCTYCNTDISNNPTMDHIVPISKGGPHSENNIVPACMQCNKKKGNKDLGEFLVTLHILTKRD